METTQLITHRTETEEAAPDKLWEEVHRPTTFMPENRLGGPEPAAGS